MDNAKLPKYYNTRSINEETFDWAKIHTDKAVHPIGDAIWENVNVVTLSRAITCKANLWLEDLAWTEGEN